MLTSAKFEGRAQLKLEPEMLTSFIHNPRVLPLILLKNYTYLCPGKNPFFQTHKDKLIYTCLSSNLHDLILQCIIECKKRTLLLIAKEF